MAPAGTARARARTLALAALATAWLAAGCLEPGSVTCADGRVCPAGTACDDLRALCVTPEQLTACAGAADGAPCPFRAASDGECVGGVCLLPTCGNHYLDPGEQCDGPVMSKVDCVEVGYYKRGSLGCDAHCQFDLSACTGARCGDGVVDKDEHEECDGQIFGTVASCQSLGFYDPGFATCDEARCRIDRNSCTGFCGDGMINGPERCELATGWTNDEACVDYGFDYGPLSCSLVCAPNFAACGTIGWRRVGAAPVSVVSAISGTRGNDVWMVGDGALYHWDGATWTAVAVTSDGADPVTSVYAAAADRVWAGLASGDIWRWDGTTWSRDHQGGDDAIDITALTGRGSAELWAVTSGGALLHGDGTPGGWARSLPPGGAALHAVWEPPAGDPWMVGRDGAVLHGTTRIDLGTTGDLTAVWGSGTHDVFIAELGVVHHWDGATWTQTPVPLGAIASLWGSSPRDLWASEAKGALARWDGRAWLRVDPPVGGSSAVWGTGVGDVWCVGSAVWRSQGHQWSSQLTQPMPPGANRVTGVAATDETNVWLSLAVGEVPSIYRFDGTSLARVAAGAFVDGWGNGPDDMWFVGGGGVKHWNGVDYTTSLSAGPLQGIWGDGPFDVWAVGAEGAYHMVQGVWTSPVAHLPLSDVWGLAPYDVWMVGAHGSILHWDGVHLTPEPAITSSDLRGIWGTRSDDLWVVGDHGTILHRTAAGWVAEPSGAGHGLPLTHVRGTASNDVWAVGRVGALLHFDGAQWSPVRSPAGDNDDLLDVAPTPGRVFLSSAVGLYTLDRPRPLSCDSAEAQCGDGVDNDCDGVIDLAGGALDCKAGPRLQEVSNGVRDYVAVLAQATTAASISLNGLALEWQQACDAEPQLYLFPADAAASPTEPFYAGEGTETGPYQRQLATPMCDGPDRSGWFALCAGPCDLVGCANVIDVLEQGTPPSPPACVTYQGAPIDVTALDPWSGVVRVRHDGFGDDARAGDWAIAPTTKP